MTGRRSAYAERQVLIIALAVGVLAALVSLVVLAGGAWAHTSEATFTGEKCIVDGAAWSATLTITATNVELDPVATVSTAASPYSVHVGASWSQLFTAQSDSITVAVALRWSDGFTKDLGSFTASRPTGCTPPASSPPAPVPSTPTVLIPPVVITPAPAVPVDSTTSSSSAPPAPPPSARATTAPPARRTPPAPSGVAVAQLPVTGSATALLGKVAVALIMIAVFLIAAARRSRRADRRPRR